MDLPKMEAIAVSRRSSRSPASTPERRYGLTFTRTGLLCPCTHG
jgi:hypothetical protein